MVTFVFHVAQETEHFVCHLSKRRDEKCNAQWMQELRKVQRVAIFGVGRGHSDDCPFRSDACACMSESDQSSTTAGVQLVVGVVKYP